MLIKYPRFQESHGFTIIEMLVTITLFALTVTLLMGFFVFVQNNQRTVQYMDTAKNAAKSKIESIRSDPVGLVNGTTQFSSSLPSNLPPGSTASVAITDSSVVGGMKNIEVQVSFKYPATNATPRVITLSALAGPSGIYQ